jgi:hypothetical protein
MVSELEALTSRYPLRETRTAGRRSRPRIKPLADSPSATGPTQGPVAVS